MADTVDVKVEPTPEPIPVPVPKPKQIRAFCVACKGTGNISLTNGPLPATDTPCPACAGTGTVVFGEMDA